MNLRHFRIALTMLGAALLAAATLTGAARAAPAPAGLALAVVKPVTGCTTLADTDLTAIGGAGSKVTSAKATTSDGIPVCAVTGILAPQIHFQALLPTQTWSQRYLQVGCGGLCGMITLRSGASSGCKVLTDGGFVMAATDMGHSGPNDDWGLDGKQRTDFAYRAQHVTALAVRKLIAVFYGQKEKFSYFNGCSDGGREALMEAERYPGDFNGVVAGAPAMLFQVQNTLYHGWMARSNRDAQGKAILLSAKLPALHQAVLAACDANDGVKDGIVADPAACHFNPETIACPAGKDDASCLTRAEIAVVDKFYAGPHDPATGAPLTAGQPLYGSELGWQGVYVPDTPDGTAMSQKIVPTVWQKLAFVPSRTAATPADWTFDTATLEALQARHPLFDATDADMSAFARAGGKLIMWHGLADQHISPANTVSLQRAMEQAMGHDAVTGFERLYLLPGVAHCGGGEGPSELDLLSAVMDWVEQGRAPDMIMTSTAMQETHFGQPDDLAGKGGRMGPPPSAKLDVPAVPDMTRPLYPYPYVAQYKGSGDWTDAANWERGPAKEVVPLHPWPGSGMFAPYTFIDQ